MATDPISGSSGSNATTHSSSDSLRDVSVDDFLKLMITELQNQDPLNPLDNSQILEQISQIHSVEATSKLTETLDAVLLGQSLASASGLIDKQIKGLSDSGAEISGRVARVKIDGGNPKLVVGSNEIGLSNVREVLP